MVQALSQKTAVGRQTQHLCPTQRSDEFVHGLFACGGMRHQLAQHGVIVGRHHQAFEQRMVEPDAIGLAKALHQAGMNRVDLTVPAADILCDRTQWVRVTSINLTTVVDGEDD